MLDFIVNPLAGGRKGKKMRQIVAVMAKHMHKLKVAHSVHFTTKAGEAKTLTEDLIANGATDIVVVGGDGTLHEVINGFSNFERVNLGLIPCGTGNDFATSLGLPKDPVEALDLIINNKPVYTDFMQMPTVRGINIIGTGIDVEVLKRYNALKKRTKFGYTRCLIKTLLSFKYTDFTATFIDHSQKYHSFIAAVANGTSYGGGIAICPVAKSNDKTLDFVAIRAMSKLKLVFAFLKLKKGKVMSVKEVEHKTMQSVDISSELPLTVQVDGEIYENIPFSVKIVSDTLKMYCP